MLAPLFTATDNQRVDEKPDQIKTDNKTTADQH
jgi:hypothetical protein